MGFSFFKKLFGSEDGEALAEKQGGLDKAGEPALRNEEIAAAPAPERPRDAGVSVEGLEEFVLYVVKALVDRPDEVTIEAVEKNDLNVIQVRCAKKDIGKIVGKSGKTISAIRALVSGAAGRGGLRATVDVLD